MDQQLHFLTFATGDLDAARSFYCEGLGWTPLLDVPDEIIFFQVASGLALGFFEAEKFDHDLSYGEKTTEVSGVVVAHNEANRTGVEHTLALFESAGGRIIKAAQEGEYGGVYHGYAADPNGIIWEIAHNPGWQVDGDGKVVFS